MPTPNVAVMVEGQHGVNWERWRKLARTVEDAGFHGLFRSDHFTDREGPYRDSLELWTSLTWLADNTDRIEFGSLVTPMSFRDPVFTARMAKDVDDLSGGRLTLGVGAGWQEREHETFGYDLLDLPERMDRFEEGVHVVTSLLRRDDPVSFDGEYYELDGAKLLPRPDRTGGPPVLVGGNGKRRTLSIAARYADEWNGVFLTPAEFSDLNDRLDAYLAEAGRDPDDVDRSVMTRVVYGRDETELRERLEEAFEGRDADDLREEGFVVGTGAEIAARLEEYGDAGVDRVMLQWLSVEERDRLVALSDVIR